MKNKKAIQLAILCVKKEIQRLAVDGNLYDKFGYDGGKFAHEQRIAL